MSEIELKPCPFCGKPPIACPDDSYGAAMVACPDVNECPVQPIADASLRKGETLATAIDRWNTRSQSERVSRLEEALKPFAQVGFSCSVLLDGSGVVIKPARQISIADFERARSALNQSNGGGNG